MKKIGILGATGVIGRHTLSLVTQHPDRFKVVSLTAGRNWRRLASQAKAFLPEIVALSDQNHLSQLREALKDLPIEVVGGDEGIKQAAAWDNSDMVVSAIVGAAGLRPTMAAIRAGKSIALANKECLVAAGALFMDEVSRQNVKLLPVDSEHSAIFQVWKPRHVERIILTASGGPFRGRTRKEMIHVTPEQALAHPRWNMGAKISIDSATLMNKGLEVIEAHWLFGMPPGRIEVVVHPESIVHSLVAYKDQSVLAQLGVPDMRTPIAVALAWPERITTEVNALNLVEAGPLNFDPPPKKEAFPCLHLAYQVLRQGGGYPAVLNAVNEVAVDAFLRKQIGFLDIANVIQHVLSLLKAPPPGSLDDILAIDNWARDNARAWIDAQN
ncbi:1-deoxy-D-xylulose-5-phosphate reductoisomerase [Magnetococcales bacterium HHB-1]